MRPPFCDFETITCEFRNFAGNTQSDAVAIPRSCGHEHDYLDFEETLNGLWPDLHLGFDRKRERYIVYRFSPQVIELDQIDGVKLKWVRRFLDIVLEMKSAEIVATKNRGKRMNFYPRRFGVWALEELARFDPRRMTPDMSWVGETLDKSIVDREVAQETRLRKNSEDMVADMMTLADRGSPWFRKKQFRQRSLRANHPKLDGVGA